MKNKYRLLPLILLLCLLSLSLVSCRKAPPSGYENAVNANEFGVLPSNSGKENTEALQALIDSIAPTGGAIYIPRGEYEFAEGGHQTIGSHCIKMASGVSIVGDGEGTVLKPTGHSRYGMDMFYFNEYLDTGSPIYLEGCRFEDFVIDAADTSLDEYTSAGKGFMFNLFRDCHWKGVTVMNTDATGFGVDCPIESTITECLAVGCGKAADENSGGASGFGIGFGYSEGESIRIVDSRSVCNRKFGFFLEHQGRFSSAKYSARGGEFLIENSTSTGNLYGFGGISAMGTTYRGCTSELDVRCGFYFENSDSAVLEGCGASGAGVAGVMVSVTTEEALYDSLNINISRLCALNSPIALKLVGGSAGGAPLTAVVDGDVLSGEEYSIYAEGRVERVSITSATTAVGEKYFSPEVALLNDESKRG